MKNLAYKYRLILSDSEKKELDRLFAISRKCWNFYVEQWNTFLKDVKKGDRHKEIRRRYNTYLKQEENTWQKVTNKRYQEYITKSLDAAWSKFFDALKKGDVSRAQSKYKANYELKKKAGTKVKWNERRFNSFYKPKFKSYLDHASITTDTNQGGARINLQEGLFWFNKKQSPFRFKIEESDKIFNYDISKFNNFTLSRTKTGKYFISVAFLGESKNEIEAKKGVVGIDLGCKDYAVLSSGHTINMPDEKLKRLKVKVKQLQVVLSRQWLKNKDNPDWNKKNWLKTKRKIAKLNERIANIRRNATHNFTNLVTANFDLIGIEELGTSGMTKKAKAKLGEDGKTFERNNKKQKAGLNRSILNKNFFETRRQLEYKAKWRKGEVVVADRYYPSSKTCNSCEEKTILKLSDREWTCQNCGCVNDRDLNAAYNLRDYAIRAVATTPETKQNVLTASASGKGEHLAQINASVHGQKCLNSDRRQKTTKSVQLQNSKNLIVNGLRIISDRCLDLF